MEQLQTKEVLAAVKEACPQDLRVSVLPTRRIRDVYILLIESHHGKMEIDDWAYEVHRLHWDKVNRLLKPHECFRALYSHDNSFILYSPFAGVFNNWEHKSGSITYFSCEERSRYIGECNGIKEVILYLTETPNLVL